MFDDGDDVILVKKGLNFYSTLSFIASVATSSIN
jgi:hypothetical protein